MRAGRPLAAFGVSPSRMSAWRDVQTGRENARRMTGARVRVIGAGETSAKVKGGKTVVGVAADADNRRDFWDWTF